MTSRAPLEAHQDDSYGGCVICREYVPHTDEEMVQVPFPCPTVRLAAISASSATETQDGERPFDTTCDDRHVRAALRANGDPDEYHRLLATPTPDDRDREVVRIAAGIQTATDAMVILYPVIEALRTWRDARNTQKNRHAVADAENNVLTQLRYFEDRAEVIDAGLRASGGKE